LTMSTFSACLIYVSHSTDQTFHCMSLFNRILYVISLKGSDIAL
jgi:hypothetical protein